MTEECGKDLELLEEKSSEDEAVEAGVKGERSAKEPEGVAAEVEADA